MSESRLRGFTVLTRCTTVEEFIDQFHDRTGPNTIFVNTSDARAAGSECGFALLLANKQPVLAGTCVVLAVFRDGNNRFKRPGMNLGIKRLGPESESVFAALEAARELRAGPDTLVEAPVVPTPAPAPPPPVAVPATPKAILTRGTAPLRMLADSGIVTSDGKVEMVVGRQTERMGSKALVPMRTGHTRIPTVQIPTLQIPTSREESTRTPRQAVTAPPPVATPVVTTPIVVVPPVVAPPPPAPKPRAPSNNVPRHVTAEGSADTRTETRTPGSSVILPANPLMNLTDASLEGLVDDCWGEPRVREPRREVVREVVREAEPEPLPAPPRRAASEADVAYIVEHRVDDSAIPSRIFNPRGSAAMMTATATSTATAMPDPSPAPRASKWRRPLAIAAGILVAVAFAWWIHDLRSTPAIAGPAVVVGSHDDVALAVRGTVGLESPPAPAPQKFHTVLVKSFPIGARVTMNGTSVGTTPTYVKVPAFTPVELQVARLGQPAVVHTLTSTQPTDQVFLDLRPTRNARRR